MNEKKTEGKKKGGGFWAGVGKFFRELNKAYYVGAAAVVSLFLLFSAWIYVPALGAISDFLKTPGISSIASFTGINVSPNIGIPQTVMTLNGTVNQVASGINGVLDFFDVAKKDANELNAYYEQIKLIASGLGIDLSKVDVPIENISNELQKNMLTGEQVKSIKSAVNQVTSIIQPIAILVGVVLLTCIGFDIYAIITAFARKKVTRGTIAAFAIPGVICLLVIIGTFAINTYVHGQIFLISSVIEPSFWAWITLVFNILGIALCLAVRKMEREELESGKTETKRAITGTTR